MSVLRLLILSFFLSGAIASVANAQTADTVYINGKIYTVNEAQPWAEAVAITDGKFTAVGSNIDIEKLIGAKTKIIDLEGKFTMPGFTEAHAHPPVPYIHEEAGNLLMNAQTADEVRAGLDGADRRRP